MSGGKHTKAPWEVLDYNGVFCRICSGKGRRIIATVPLGTPANARLIAAAPDLLAALKALDAYWCEMLPDGPPADDADHWLHADSRAVWRTARAAIAKAEGGAA